MFGCTQALCLIWSLAHLHNHFYLLSVYFSLKFRQFLFLSQPKLLIPLLRRRHSFIELNSLLKSLLVLKPLDLESQETLPDFALAFNQPHSLLFLPF